MTLHFGWGWDKIFFSPALTVPRQYSVVLVVEAHLREGKALSWTAITTGGTQFQVSYVHCYPVTGKNAFPVIIFPFFFGKKESNGEQNKKEKTEEQVWKACIPQRGTQNS